MPPPGDLNTGSPPGRGRRWIRWIGTLLALTAVVFLARQLQENAGQISTGQLEGAWFRVLIAAGGYFLCGLPLGLIWWLSVRGAGGGSPPLVICVPVHLASQLGKYLPGNVAHFAARHLMMRKHGSRHVELVAAGLLEALALVVAAGVLAAWVIHPAADRLLGWNLPEGAQLATLAVAATVAIAAWVIARRRGWIAASVPARTAALAMLAAVLVAVAFFLGMSACFILVSTNVALSDAVDVVPWIAASWLLGFIVPGAPGGIGVRELVLVLGLTPLVGEGPAVLDAALFRLVTVAGDALMALAGLIAMRRASS